jgi:hypothetical protein
MNPTLEATETRVETATDAVRDFDELDTEAQTVLHDAATGDIVAVPEDAADEFTDGEVVRFTGYYRIRIAR